MNRLCQIAGVSRAGYYRFQLRAPSQRADMDLRSEMQKIALEWPAYGYRRVHRELIRRGWGVNHKRVLRLMRMDNLLCLRKRRFILTTDSKHGLHIYPNVAKDMVLSDINQLWIADITYIRLEVEFVYLAVLLDAFSRSCIGWALQRSLEAALVLEALRMALKKRRPRPGLVHHSDRGVQYASQDYTDELDEHAIRISMSRRGNVYDNAKAESFIKTLKYILGIENAGSDLRMETMRIYLVQHGASKSEAEDPQRSLTDEGSQTVEKMVDYLKGAGVAVNRIKHSDKLRARQTAEILAGRLKPQNGIEQVSGMAPNDDVSAMRISLHAEAENVMLVGHLPYLSRLLSSLLLVDENRPLVEFRMGGIVCLVRGENAQFRILWAITPDLLNAANSLSQAA